MSYRLNPKSHERLKALVRAGQYTSDAWGFSADDSNALLGDPANWTEYEQWFLGIDQSVSLDGQSPPAPPPQKAWFAYPYGKGGKVYLAGLKQLIAAAKGQNESDIADAASAALALAEQIDADKKTASGKACDLDISFKAAKAQIAAAAAAGKKLPTFHAVAYTGVPMQLNGFNHPVIIDYDGIDVTAHSRPALRDHDEKRPIGHTTSVAVVNGQLEADGEISIASQDAKEVADSGKNGFPWQISVGMKVLRSQFVPEGDTAQANGKTWSGPLIIARQTSLREISFLTLGADDNTSARIAANAAKKGATMALKKKFAAWAKARNITMADMEDDGFSSAAKAMYKAQMKAEADDPEDEDDDGKDEKKDTKSAAIPADLQARASTDAAGAAVTPAQYAATMMKEIRANVLTERQRLAGINRLLDDARPSIDAQKFSDIEAKAISGEYDATRLELELIKAKRPSTGPYINTGAGSAPDGAVIAAAAARSYGVAEKVAYQGLNQQQGNIAASLRGLTLHGIIAIAAERLGLQARPGGIDRDFLDRFLPLDKAAHRTQLNAADPMIRASSAGGFSTMSLTGITENILYKAMLESYGLQESVVSDIAYERDTNDFKPFKVYRLTASGDFEPPGPAGELKSFSLQDESYTNQVSTRGALLTLKREDIINDDMGALMQAPQVLGRKASLNREKAVLTTFISGLNVTAPGASVGKTANGFNFWSTGAGNYLSGASSALSISAVQTARQKFLQQKDANGDPIMIRPDRLLVSPENEGVADNLFQGANLTVQALDSSSGTSSNKQTVNLNQHKGKYRPIVSPYLGGSSPIAGATATQWALLTNPAGGMAPVQVGYLRGQRTPIIKQVEVDASVLGLAYQAIFDFGVALLDYRCGVYSAGQ